MGDDPCGCQKLEEAESDQDKGSREALESLGRLTAERWRCPRYTGEGEPSEAPDGVQPTLKRVEALTGAQGLTTCPCWYATQPAVAVACNARQWAERGLLKERYGEPPLALMQSVEVLDGAIAARDRAERKEKDKERKRNGGKH